MCRFWSCVISALETFSGVGLHALLILNSGAPGAAASGPLAVEPLAAVGPSRIPFHEGHGCSIPQKQLLNIALMQGFGFLWSRRPVKGHFLTTFRPYIYVFIQKNRIYTYYTAYIYAGQNSYTVYTNTGTEKIYLYIRIYTVCI